MKEVRNKYGVPTPEFSAVLEPHESAIRLAVNALLDTGYSYDAVQVALCDSVCGAIVERRLGRAVYLRKAEREMKHRTNN